MTDTTKPVTLVTNLVDRSYSMKRRLMQTIEGINAGILELKQEPETAIEYSLVLFDTDDGRVCLDPVYVAEPIASVSPLTTGNYVPRGGTPLRQAAIVTIQAIEQSLAARDDKPRVIVNIQTDGQENDSGPEFTWQALKALIEEKKAGGWEFNFIGAAIDAYQQAELMGIEVARTMSYGDDIAETRAAFSASAMNARDFGAGRSANTQYSMLQKAAAGDRFDPALKPLAGAAVPSPQAPAGGLDLSGLGNGNIAGSPFVGPFIHRPWVLDPIQAGGLPFVQAPVIPAAPVPETVRLDLTRKPAGAVPAVQPHLVRRPSGSLSLIRGA